MSLVSPRSVKASPPRRAGDVNKGQCSGEPGADRQQPESSLQVSTAEVSSSFTYH